MENSELHHARSYSVNIVNIVNILFYACAYSHSFRARILFYFKFVFLWFQNLHLILHEEVLLIKILFILRVLPCINSCRLIFVVLLIWTAPKLAQMVVLSMTIFLHLLSLLQIILTRLQTLEIVFLILSLSVLTLRLLSLFVSRWQAMLLLSILTLKLSNNCSGAIIAPCQLIANRGNSILISTMSATHKILKNYE